MRTSEELASALQRSAETLVGCFEEMQYEAALGFTIRNTITPGRELMYWSQLARLRRGLLEKRHGQAMALREALATGDGETIHQAFTQIDANMTVETNIALLPRWFSDERRNQWTSSMMSIQKRAKRAAEAYTEFIGAFNEAFGRAEHSEGPAAPPAFEEQEA